MTAEVTVAALTARDIEAGLMAIGRKAKADGRLIELSVYGGSAIVLVFGTSDLADIHRLMRHTGRTTAGQLIEVVERFYPAKLVTPRVAFGIRQIAEQFAAERER